MKKIALILILFLFCGCSNITIDELLPETPFINGEFEVHFIDVGQADCALVICEGKTMLIDGGNVADSSFIYS